MKIKRSTVRSIVFSFLFSIFVYYSLIVGSKLVDNVIRYNYQATDVLFLLALIVVNVCLFMVCLWLTTLYD